jgi:farnesyl-diphosphate farnesyltransferase
MSATISNSEYCIQMLPRVSRTFAPTIRMLPRPLYLPVTIAYLLCRIADTVEDDAHLGKQEKQVLLQHYANYFTKQDPVYKEKFLMGIQKIPDHSTDVHLAKNLDRVLAVYNTFSATLKNQISIWVVEMSLGMKKFAQEHTRKKFQFLRSMKDLDEYTYYVAGTVGHMLTSLFAHFSKKITPPVVKRLEQFSESFGKGLQLVNIIRDMKGDLTRGQSYIPDEILQKYRLTRKSIFNVEHHEQAEKMFNELIQTAVAHLDRALAYIVNIPKEETRIRLFCLLPVCWAMQTLRIIQKNTLALLHTDKIKISRYTIRIEFFKSLILIFSNRLTIRHYRKIRKDIRPEPLLLT